MIIAMKKSGPGFLNSIVYLMIDTDFYILTQSYGLSRHDNNIVFGFDGDISSPFIVTHTNFSDRFRSIKAYAK